MSDDSLANMFKMTIPKLAVASPPILPSVPEASLDFDSKLAFLKKLVTQEGGDIELLKISLKDLKSYLVSEPTRVAEMLPEDIGSLVAALLKVENLRIVADAAPKAGKSKKIKLAPMDATDEANLL